MNLKPLILCFTIAMLVALAGCPEPRSTGPVTEIARFPLDSIDELITKEGVELDKQISTDGNGSVRIESVKKTIIPLLEVDSLDIEDGTLIYQVKIRTDGKTIFAYPEMMVGVSGVGKGEYKSSGSEKPVVGVSDWTIAETLFLFMKGQSASHAKLSIVTKGKGTVWIDEIRLLKAPAG